jgi:1,4-dihydroxy-2-naphthoate polyprenyltransferase
MMTSTTTTQTPSKMRAWYAATRPRVFVATFVPMALAAVIALQDGVFSLSAFLLSLIGVMLLQTVANLVNEYADFYRGADELKQAGQGMAIKQYGLTPREVLFGAIFCGVTACLIGLYFLTQSGPWLLAIGLGGVLVAITYTAGPFPLAYYGLGEVAAGIFMGPMIVLGAYYVMNPNITAEKGLQICLMAFPIMFTCANILHANNVRDRDADMAANKRTLAVRFGVQIARQEYSVLMVAAYISQIILVLMGWYPITTLISWLTIPLALRLIRTINTEADVAKLHIAQGQTAQHHGMFGFLIAIGWLIDLVI